MKSTIENKLPDHKSLLTFGVMAGSYEKFTIILRGDDPARGYRFISELVDRERELKVISSVHNIPNLVLSGDLKVLVRIMERNPLVTRMIDRMDVSPYELMGVSRFTMAAQKVVIGTIPDAVTKFPKQDYSMFSFNGFFNHPSEAYDYCRVDPSIIKISNYYSPYCVCVLNAEQSTWFKLKYLDPLDSSVVEVQSIRHLTLKDAGISDELASRIHLINNYW